ncbi:MULTISPECIES: sensor histidine kinase [Galbibacter]|uniref:sensor histidine kinase n=1 Tax=Galbibacter TaxID=379068 RepID=UPI003009D037
MALLAYSVTILNGYIIIVAATGSFMAAYSLYKFTVKRFVEIDDFFEAVRYRDFSRWYSEKHGSKDMQRLHRGFNEVNRTIKDINSQKETQYLYLQKILEVVQVGIIAYDIKTGGVLWINESLKRMLDIPSIKNISFIESRKQDLYERLFVVNHANSASVTLEIGNEKSKMLVSNAIFEVASNTFKLVVLQNIDDTLNKNESEAWKKLLSVMTHEIMNSIAPISSLAETLKGSIQESMEAPELYPLITEDLYEGIESIKKRSDGLMKFAKTYRSLNKITQLNPHLTKVEELFHSINRLMLPSLEAKGVLIAFEIHPLELELEIDAYLIEQVLINLILNAVDACVKTATPTIKVLANQSVNGNTIIRVTDNGRGIPEEIMDTVFVPFYSTKKNGSGIGLSLCKQIMLLHRGKVQIQSVVGRGTTISLVF